ncbi:MAG: ABC transporter ATP-binding protein [Alphaproteobacteria bacterium]
MARIELTGVSHSYGALEALQKFDLTWEDGGRYAILGPSGCGKTTMLNIMSGIIQPTNGTISFDGQDVTALETADRNIAQVFQFPVIYNTMRVWDNLAFPLVCRDTPKKEIKAKVEEVADTLSLTELLDKPANRLTADQKQLISLGRGLVRDDVAAVLMDEPLTVIDPDLKFRLRRKLKEINEKYRTTLIYVTHDQNEAMTFAQKIMVMDAGKIVQMGTPSELFDKPSTTFVGYFIGAPAMNLFEAKVIGEHKVELDGHQIIVEPSLSKLNAGSLRLGVRAENMKLLNKKPKAGSNSLPIQVNRVDDFGNYKLVVGSCCGSDVKVKVDRDQELGSGSHFVSFDSNKACVYMNEYIVN